MMIAVKYHQPEVLKLLLASGRADVNMQTKQVLLPPIAPQLQPLIRCRWARQRYTKLVIPMTQKALVYCWAIAN